MNKLNRPQKASRYASCPACDSPLDDCNQEQDRIYVECPVCGKYCFEDSPVFLSFSQEYKPDAICRIVLAHRIRQMTLTSNWPLVSDATAQRALKDFDLPKPFEQADKAVLYLGQAQDHAGSLIELSWRQWEAIMGARDPNGVRFVLRSLEKEGFIEFAASGSTPNIRLTMNGWSRYDDLRHARSDSRRAFMAMPFGSADLDLAFLTCFRPAVSQAGFDLFRIDEDPKAGLIDDRIRVAILGCRFLVADLTNSNAGAYWEAGFAEGLGKPVIYTCQDTYFEKHRGTHFDTRNRHTVVWSAEELGEAAERLTTSIRATLPDEAILQDKVVS